MTCSNCFNGCSEIHSDQCVKYTGADITSLGISNGDPLSTVISQLSTYLIDAMDGSGITPDIETSVRDLIAGYLGSGTTLNDYISALIQAAYSLQGDVDTINNTLSTLNANYTVDCLSGVTASSDTHDIVQAVIVKLCSVEDTLTALSSTVSTNYVALADLNSLITAYLASSSLTTLMSSKMVPYTAVPFFAPDAYMIGKFDATGAGIGAWANIYLCNGRNSTPDMRGRVPVCATSGMNGDTYNSAVDPGITGNPSYSLNTVTGANNVALTNVNQIPSHTHAATVSLTDPTHTHFTVSNSGTNQALSSTNYVRRFNNGAGNGDYTLMGWTDAATMGLTSAKATGITATVSNSYVGAAASHSNIQPVIAAYYIMYIPS